MGLDRMRRILHDLGNPHLNLPPVLHVAGTNGKGSTVAFMRSILEQAGLTAHIMTSPHLVSFNERLVIASRMIDDDALLNVLQETEAGNAGQPATFFELITAAGFLAFSKSKADLCILETGMGGRLDGTNVIDAPLGTAITSISFDHMQHLGNSLTLIAAEKAGIMKPGVPCVIGPQTDEAMRAGVMDVFEDHAQSVGAPLIAWSRDWDYEVADHGLVIQDHEGRAHFPAPSLTGLHQYANAATALVLLRYLAKNGKINIPEAAFDGIARARWPARLQNLAGGALSRHLPDGFDLWLDGGHNDHAGMILADQALRWEQEAPRPLYLIVGMINTKDPTGFLKPLLPHVSGIITVAIPDHHLSLQAEALAEIARQAAEEGKHSIPVTSAGSVEDALSRIKILANTKPPGISGNHSAKPRVLIAGSLYLAGHVLKSNI